MRIETILNKCQKFKSFIYKNVRWGTYDNNECIEAEIVPRKNSRAICSGCGKPTSLYDKLNVRWFEFVPLWGYRVFFIYQMRRVNCKICGVLVEAVPWASGKYSSTKTHMKFLADWAKKIWLSQNFC